MKILVTGGAGYIGSTLVPLLLVEGHKVRVLDIFRYSQMSLAACAQNPQLELIRGDVRDVTTVQIAALGMDMIIHLAALVGAPLCDQERDNAVATNFVGTANVVQTALPVVYPCTNSGYGRSTEPVTEESPLNPLSVYGQTKVDGEKLVLQNGGISLRLATVFGMSPRMRTDLLVNDFVLTALRHKYLRIYEPQAMRSVVHVHDVCSAMLWAVHMTAKKISRSNLSSSGIYNVVGKNISKLDLAQGIAKQIPGTVVVAASGADPDQRDCIVSNQKLAEAGWSAKIELVDGVRELIRGLSHLRQHEFGNV